MRKEYVTRLWAWVLSLAAVFGAMGCLVSGFGLEPMGFGTVLSWILAATVFSICFPRRISLYPLAGLVLLGIFLWLRGYLSRSMELLLQELSNYMLKWVLHLMVVIQLVTLMVTMVYGF